MRFFERRYATCFCVLAISSIALIFTGCSGGTGLTAVSGNITLDGQPVENGSISFEPVDGIGPATGAVIESGKYQTETTPGEKTVRVTATKVVGQTQAYPGKPESVRDVHKSIIPKKYNTNSELTITVESKETNADFELSSK